MRRNLHVRRFLCSKRHSSASSSQWNGYEAAQRWPLLFIIFSNSIEPIVPTQNTECLYAQKEKWALDSNLGGKVAIAERHISEKASRRIARFAFTVVRFVCFMFFSLRFVRFYGLQPHFFPRPDSEEFPKIAILM